MYTSVQISQERHCYPLDASVRIATLTSCRAGTAAEAHGSLGTEKCACVTESSTPKWWATLSCVLASAAQVSRHDGNFWNRLGKHEKAACVAGYSDAARTSLDKLHSLELAVAAFHWKGANRVLSQLARELNMSSLEANDLTAYLDSVYSIEEHLALPFETKVLGVAVTVERIDLTQAGEIVIRCRAGRGHREAHVVCVALEDRDLSAAAGK
jgi:hypothetical protein